MYCNVLICDNSIVPAVLIMLQLLASKSLQNISAVMVCRGFLPLNPKS